MTKIGHFAPRAMPLVILVMVALGVIGFLPAEAVAAYAACMLALIYAESWHDARHCGLCQAATPPNGAESATRRDRTLRLVHAVRAHQIWAVGYVLSVVVTVLVVANVFDLSSYVVARMLDLTLMIPAAASMLMFNTHDRLRPWCPYCRRRGGWEWWPPEAAPDPDPGGRRMFAAAA